jgi:hypothetical protein
LKLTEINNHYPINNKQHGKNAFTSTTIIKQTLQTTQTKNKTDITTKKRGRAHKTIQQQPKRKLAFPESLLCLKKRERKLFAL